jgi:aminocarboxymuconate-semialdehyde decarboxylase
MLACGCNAIDVHTHFVPERFPPYLGLRKSVPWPSMTPAQQPCHAHVMISGAVYRTVSQRCWDGEMRLADMQRQGISRQVVSPMPELLAYWLEAEDTGALAAHVNESIASLVHDKPESFIGLGMIALQSTKHAIAGLEHAVKTLGLAGVQIGSNVNGVPIGDPRFRPFFEAATALGAAVFVHPLRPAGTDRLVGPRSLEQVVAFPGEIGLAAASMITGGNLSCCPGLRIAFSHGGGSLPVLLSRLQHAWLQVPAVRDLLERSPLELASTMWFDDLVYDSATIRHLIHVYGISQVMIGSDYPFTIMDHEPRATVEALSLDESEVAALISGNADRWLGVTAKAQKRMPAAGEASSAAGLGYQ